MIPIYQPTLSQAATDNVLDCLNTNWISSKGTYIPAFESAFCDYTGARFASTVSNGTVALHLALLALGIGHGDEVIVPTFTYVASVNAIRYTGATPIFADSVDSTWQLSPDSLEEKISPATKAIMVVHLYGHPCDMRSIMGIAERHGLHVIEDCAEAIGTLYEGKHVGNFGAISTFSFFGNKTITTGEGGMVITDDPTLISRVNHLKGQGLAKDREYWHESVGYNYRMTNIAASIGLSQMPLIEGFVSKKRNIAEMYRDNLRGLPLSVHGEANGCRHSYWMVSILLDEFSHRDELRNFLRKKDVETRPTFYPVHTMPMYSDRFERLPIAENLSMRGINLPSWPSLTDTQVQYVTNSIREFFEILSDGSS